MEVTKRVYFLYRRFAVNIVSDVITEFISQIFISSHSVQRFKQRIDNQTGSKDDVRNNLLNAMEKGIWTLRTERWGGGRKTMIIHHNRIVFILELYEKQYVLKTCWDLDSFKRRDEINRYLVSVSQTARLSKIDLRFYLSKQTERNVGSKTQATSDDNTIHHQ
eukprot:330508_1